MAEPCRDLESIVTMLEVGALCLTESPSSRFTKAELFAEARRIASDVVFEDRDLEIVLAGMGSVIKRESGGLLCIR